MLRTNRRIVGICLTAGLGLSALFAPAANAGILEALDKLMRNYANGIVDQGDKAWATMKAVFTKPPEGSSRGAQFDAAFKSYAETFYADGTLGGNALADLKALVNEMLTVSNWLPGPLKAAWEAAARKLAGLKARFMSRVEKPWDDAAAEAAYNGAAGGSAVAATSLGGGDGLGPGGTGFDSAPEPEEPAPGPAPAPADEPPAASTEQPEAEDPATDEAAVPAGDDAPGDDAAADAGTPPPPPSGLTNPLDGAGETSRASVLRASALHVPDGVPAAPVSTRKTDEKVAELFGSYVYFLYDTGNVRHMVETQIDDEEIRRKVYPAVVTVQDHASRMEDQLADAIVGAARQGKPSVSDLDVLVKRMKPATARYYLRGVVSKVDQKLKWERSPAARQQAKRLQGIRTYMGQ